MNPSPQRGACATRVSLWSERARTACLLAFAAVLMPAVTCGQQPANAIGQVEGRDISVEGGTPAANVSPGAARVTIYVVNGAVVTVHSGEARLTLAAGGRVDVCGPAKFTILQSGSAITLALNFGRMRPQLPAGTSLRIFTPTIVATPLDIGGEPRDVTVGLDLNDSLCVVATSGALRLEQQFSGEGLIVPQSGEFFLEGGKLMPVAGTPGSCQCQSIEARALVPSQPAPVIVAGADPAAAPAAEPRNATPEPKAEAQAAAPPVVVVLTPTLSAPTAQPRKKTKPELPPDTPPGAVVVAPELLPATPAPAAPVQPEPTATAKPEASAAEPPAVVVVPLTAPPPPAEEAQPAKPSQPAPEPAVEVGELASANEKHPVAPAPKPDDTSPPAVSIPDYQVVMPPLRFTAGDTRGPAAPLDASPELAILVRTARVQRDWEFTGRVEAPPARTKPVALNTGPEKPGPQSQPAPKAEKRKGGFWSAFKRIFTGNG